MCVTTINDRKVPVNLKEKQEGCMEKMEWNRGKGKWCNYILQSYKKKKEYFSNQRQYHINNPDLEKETVPEERWQWKMTFVCVYSLRLNTVNSTVVQSIFVFLRSNTLLIIALNRHSMLYLSLTNSTLHMKLTLMIGKIP